VKKKNAVITVLQMVEINFRSLSLILRPVSYQEGGGGGGRGGRGGGGRRRRRRRRLWTQRHRPLE
jgi:hypothetical protein